MDLNDTWQENKRFVLTVAAGVIVFVTGTMVVDALFKSELVALRRSADSAAARLRGEPMYSASDLDTAERENEELDRAVQELSRQVAFEPREAFRLDAKRGSASNQYFASVAGVREELLTLAGRSNLKLPEDLGLPALSPTREAEIVRYLEALDLIDRAVRLALSAGVERVDKIDIKLDPKLSSRQGVGNVERTRVAITLSGSPGPMVRFLRASQAPAPAEPSTGAAPPARASPAPQARANPAPQARANRAPDSKTPRSAAPGAEPLLIETLDMVPRAKGEGREATLEVVFLAPRVQVASPGAESLAEGREGGAPSNERN